MAACNKLMVAIALFLVLVCQVQASTTDSDVSTQFSGLPTCGVSCYASAINANTCAGTDLDCICADAKFIQESKQCLTDHCSMRDVLAATKVTAQACKQPTRNRKNYLLIPLAAEIPAWLCPWIRLYSKWLTLGGWEVEDYLLLVVGLVYTATLFVGQYIGQMAFGVDIWMVDPDVLTQAIKLFFISESFYIVSLCLCKVSMLFFYLRTFTDPIFNRRVYIAIAFTVLPTIVILFLQIFQCIPVNYTWERWLGPSYSGYCLDLRSLAFTAAGFSIVQDLIILLLPLPELFYLETSTRAKVGIGFMFSLGMLVTGFSCVRIRYLLNFDRSANPTWDYVDAMVWTGIELSMAIIVACLPAIWVLMKRIVPRLVDRVGDNNNDHSVSEARSQSSMSKRPIVKGEIRHMVILHDNHDGYDKAGFVELGAADSDFNNEEGHIRADSGTLGSGYLANPGPGYNNNNNRPHVDSKGTSETVTTMVSKDTATLSTRSGSQRSIPTRSASNRSASLRSKLQKGRAYGAPL